MEDFNTSHSERYRLKGKLQCTEESNTINKLDLMECVEQNPTTCEYVSQHLRMLTTDFVLRYKDVSKMSKSISLPGKNSDLEIIKKKKKKSLYYLTSSIIWFLQCSLTPVCGHLPNRTHLQGTALISREQCGFFFFPPCWLEISSPMISPSTHGHLHCFRAAHQKGVVANIPTCR